LTANKTVAALLVVATAVGVGFQIPNAANLAGYTAELLSHGVSAGWGDVRLRPAAAERFADGDGLAARARRVPGVRAVAPILMLPGAAGHGGRFVSLPIAGIDVGAGPGAERAPFRVMSGAPLAAGDADGVLVGASAAERLGVAVGDRISLRVILSAAPRAVLDDGGIGRYELTVRGIVSGYFGAFDPVYVSRAFLGGELGAPGAVTQLFVYSDAPFEAASLARRLEAALPEASARDWLDDSPLLRGSIEASAAIGRMSGSMVFFAVAVPVAALLYISVLQRRRDTALLGALGFGRRDLFLAVLAQAFLVAVAGGLVGAALGCGLVALFQRYPVFAWHTFVVRPVLSLDVLLRSSLLVVAAAMVAALYPAWRAARLDPAPVLREIG
jgi:lipoprotein-releasing system permease protein